MLPRVRVDPTVWGSAGEWKVEEPGAESLGLVVLGPYGHSRDAGARRPLGSRVLPRLPARKGERLGHGQEIRFRRAHRFPWEAAAAPARTSAWTDPGWVQFLPPRSFGGELLASLDDSETSLTVTLTREEGGSGGGLERRFRYLVLLTTLVADYRGRPVEQFVLLQAIDRYEDPRLSPNRTVSFVAHLTAALPDASYQIRLCEVQLATGAGLRPTSRQSCWTQAQASNSATASRAYRSRSPLSSTIAEDPFRPFGRKHEESSISWSGSWSKRRRQVGQRGSRQTKRLAIAGCDRWRARARDRNERGAGRPRRCTAAESTCDSRRSNLTDIPIGPRFQKLRYLAPTEDLANRPPTTGGVTAKGELELSENFMNIRPGTAASGTSPCAERLAYNRPSRYLSVGCRSSKPGLGRRGGGAHPPPRPSRAREPMMDSAWLQTAASVRTDCECPRTAGRRSRGGCRLAGLSGAVACRVPSPAEG